MKIDETTLAMRVECPVCRMGRRKSCYSAEYELPLTKPHVQRIIAGLCERITSLEALLEMA